MFYVWEELSVFFTSLLGQKRLILFLSLKIQVFKVTDGLAIVSCQRLLISSEAGKMYKWFYQVCSKKPQQSKTFWSKAQSKIPLSLDCTCDSSYTWKMWVVPQNEFHLFKSGTDLQGLCFLLKIMKCQSKKKSLKNASMQGKNTWVSNSCKYS